jgi:hypothetical protein
MRSPGPSFDLRAALRAEVRAALDELDTGFSDPKAVHRTRVRLKRARALARVGRISAPGLAEVFNDSARACMHALAPVRDANALAEAARNAARKEGKKAGKALSRAADRLAMTPTAFDMDTVHTGLKDLLALAQVWPDASQRQIRRGAERIARRAKRARKHAIGAAAADVRHTWRKREKERLYVADILGPSWPRGRKRRATTRLTDTLGHERDARLLAERLQDSVANDDASAARAVRALKRRGRKLAARADKIGRKLEGV